MIESVKHCLRNLANVNGRDTRRTYWLYLLFLFVLQLVAGFIISIPMLGGMVSGAMEAAQTGADPVAINQAMAGQVAGSMRNMMTWNTVVSFAAVALFCAAAVRRLHDASKPGVLVLAAIVPVLYVAIMTYINADAIIELTVQAMQQTGSEEAAAAQAQLSVQSLIGYAGYLAAIVFGFLPSTAGPNKYGDVPAA